AFYRRCYCALRPGGGLIKGGCAPPPPPPGVARGLGVLFAPLRQTFGSRGGGGGGYETRGDGGGYGAPAAPNRPLRPRGFAVDVPWRRSPFAVIVGSRHA